jgi:hypothetical protein
MAKHMRDTEGHERRSIDAQTASAGRPPFNPATPANAQALANAIVLKGNLSPNQGVSIGLNQLAASSTRFCGLDLQCLRATATRLGFFVPGICATEPRRAAAW